MYRKSPLISRANPPACSACPAAVAQSRALELSTPAPPPLASARPRRRHCSGTRLWWSLAWAAVACVDDSGLGPGPDEPGPGASLALRAELVGLAQTVTYTVRVAMSYEAADGLEQLGDPVSFSVTGGAGPAPQRIPIRLDECLSDPTRIEAGSGGCRLWVALTLSDPSGDLAGHEQALGLVREGDQIEPAEPVVLTPSYPLTIEGGGPATGSGTVTVPAAAGQPALSCAITGGQAAAEGCSARYPLHTTLALTVSPAEGSTLDAWGADCGAAAATGPCALTMDGPRTASAGFTVPPTTGDLEIQIAGLPPDVAAQVTVSNTRGFSQAVGQTDTLTALSPGDDYIVTAGPVEVPAEQQTYTPSPAAQRIAIVAGQRSTVQIGYNPQETGSLAVTILGVPEDASAAVTVSGPSFPQGQPLASGQTLTRLLPGLYTVDAEPVETAEQLYSPTPRSQTSQVLANATANDTVTYEPIRGALLVAISGLPAGTPGQVTVTGPNLYRQELTSTTVPPLVKLIPGFYVVTADSVISLSGIPYFPFVIPSDSIAIAAGQTATVEVSYNPPIGIRSGSTTITPSLR